jgi:hypothetical protein
MSATRGAHELKAAHGLRPFSGFAAFPTQH